MWAFLLTPLLSKRGNCDVVRERTDTAGKKRHAAFPAVWLTALRCVQVVATG